MKHAVTAPMPPFKSPGGRLEIHRVPAWTDNIIWIARCLETGIAAVIDGPEAGPMLDYCAANDIELSVLLNTHTHPDHIGINRDLERRGRLDDLQVVGSQIASQDVPGITTTLTDGEPFHIGNVQGTVILTEGHIDGHLTYAIDGALFCGDAMFGAGCGYLFVGPPAKMHKSLQRLAKEPPESLVCCAHEYTQDNLRFAWMMEPGNEALAERIKATWALRARGECSVPSTIADERATNPFVRVDAEQIVANARRLAPDLPLESAVERFTAVRALKDRKLHKDIPDADLPI